MVQRMARAKANSWSLDGSLDQRLAATVLMRSQKSRSMGKISKKVATNEATAAAATQAATPKAKEDSDPDFDLAMRAAEANADASSRIQSHSPSTPSS